MAGKLPLKSPIYKYPNLIKNTSEYAKKMTRLRNKIFNEVARPTSESSMRIVRKFAERPLDMNPEIASYYPRYIETNGLMRALRSYGLYRDEHADFQEEMERLRELRGKGKVSRTERLRKEWNEKKAAKAKAKS